MIPGISWGTSSFLPRGGAAAALLGLNTSAHRRCRGAQPEIGALDAGAATWWVRGSPPPPRRTPQASRSLRRPDSFQRLYPFVCHAQQGMAEPHRRLASGGGNHRKKWVRREAAARRPRRCRSSRCRRRPGPRWAAPGGREVTGPGEALAALAHLGTGPHRPAGASDTLVRAGRLGAGRHEMTEADIGAAEVTAGRQAGLEHQHRRGAPGRRDSPGEARTCRCERSASTRT
jgi:hypothetical protein